MSSLVYLSLLLIVIGLYGILVKVNVLKMALGVILMVLGVAGLVVAAGSDGTSVVAISQSVGLIAVVGGSSVVVLLIVTAVRLHEKYGSLDIREMRRLKG